MTKKPLHAAMLAAGMVLALTAEAMAQVQWRDYDNYAYGFAAELPLGQFAPTENSTAEALTLTEIGGDGAISIRAGAVPSGASLDLLAEGLLAELRIDNVTYRQSGNSWFVASGYLNQKARGGGPLVYYAKLLLSSDRDTFSAFEISYPAQERHLYDPLVERIEDGFSRPAP